MHCELSLLPYVVIHLWIGESFSFISVIPETWRPVRWVWYHRDKTSKHRNVHSIIFQAIFCSSTFSFLRFAYSCIWSTPVFDKLSEPKGDRHYNISRLMRPADMKQKSEHLWWFRYDRFSMYSQVHIKVYFFNILSINHLFPLLHGSSTIG